MEIAVKPLSNYPEAIATVAEWHFTEWGHTDPGGSLQAWTAGMASQAGADAIPGTLIAVAAGAPRRRGMPDRPGHARIRPGRRPDPLA